MNQRLEPAGWAPPVGYANGIAAKGRNVYIAGQIGWNAQQKFETMDLAGQFGKALENILAVLAEAGGKAEHICRMTCFCTDKDEYLAKRKAIGAEWKRVIGKHFPAMSMIFVVALLDEGAKVEIEATAVVPD
jgi:enamine deaminase RidA (YjgF/YER057c/UK114 family)